MKSVLIFILILLQFSAVSQEMVDSLKPENLDNKNIIVTVNDVSFEMVFVEGGTFVMGNNEIKKSTPEHQVTLDGFYIGKFEVTQALWKAVMLGNPSFFPDDNNPVENVGLLICEDFLKKLSNLTGYNFRFPTEAEWEFAARGGNKSQGYIYAGSNDVNEVAWLHRASGETTMPVGLLKPNELGIYDMSGNVEEYCSDWYGAYSAEPQVNPQGPNRGASKVRRGGGWPHLISYGETTRRYWQAPTLTKGYNAGGLRVAMDAK